MPSVAGKLLFALFLFFVSPFYSLSQNIDSLKNLVETSKGTHKVNLLYELSFAESQSRPTEALDHAQQAFDLAASLKYKQGQASSLHTMAVVYRFQGYYDKSILYEDSALTFIRNQSPGSVNAAIYSNLAVSYRAKGDYEKALESFQSAIELHKSLGENTDVGIVLNNLGVMYMYLEDYPTALSYYQKAITIQREEDNKKEVANVLNNFAIVYANQNLLDSSLHYFQESLRIEEDLNNLRGISECINNIGAVYYYMGETEMAITEIRKSFAIDSLLGDERGMIMSMNNIAEILNETGQPARALRILEESLKKARSIDSKYDISTAYINMASAYQKLGEYKAAFETYQKYAAVHDSVLGEQQQTAIAEMETKYQTKEKEQQITIQNLEIEEQNTELGARKNLIIGLITGLLLLILSGILAYRAYRARKESELQKAIATEQEKRLAAVIEATEEERARVSKELHDGIGQQLSSLKLGLSNFASSQQNLPKGDEDKITLLQKVVDESAHDVRELSHQMMPKSLTELGLESALRDMFAKSLGLVGIEYEFDSVNSNTRMAAKIEVNLYRVAQELINNIIKHSGANKVRAELVKTKRSVELNIEDNGKGIDSASTDGHGLLNIKSRIDHLKGVIELINLPKGGTAVKIRVPLTDTIEI